MKIAQVSPYDFAHPGGVQEHIRYLQKYLSRMGHQVFVLAPSSDDQEALEDRVIKVSGTVVPVPFSGSVARISLSPRVYRRVKHLLETYRFDIVHLHEPLTPLLPLAVLRHSKAVNVGTFHAYREDDAPHFEYGKPFIQPFVNRIDGPIAVSRAVVEYVGRFFSMDFRLIPNGIEIERFGASDLRPVERFQDDKLNVLFVGRLEKRKGFRYLLEAFTQIKREVPKARLLVVGAYDEDDVEPYLGYVQQRRLADVHFVGKVSASALPRYYATADVFCAPSTGFESFGIVLLEAMASRVPIVASDIFGYREVLASGEEGLLVPPKREGPLAKAVIRLLKDPEQRRRMGRKGREKAHRYAWQKVTRQVSAYYEELLERRRTDVRDQEQAERYLRDLHRKVSGWLEPKWDVLKRERDEGSLNVD